MFSFKSPKMFKKYKQFFLFGVTYLFCSGGPNPENVEKVLDICFFCGHLKIIIKSARIVLDICPHKNRLKNPRKLRSLKIFKEKSTKIVIIIQKIWERPQHFLFLGSSQIKYRTLLSSLAPNGAFWSIDISPLWGL